MQNEEQAGLEMRPVSIGLLWHSFMSENLGVGALSVANMQLIGLAAKAAGLDPFFEIIGIRGQTDYTQIAGYPCRFTNIGFKALATPNSQLYQAIGRCDILFDIGGGDSFSDIYGWRRLALILGSKWAALLQKKPLIFSPQTIGPFEGSLARRLASITMRHAERVFVRDALSLDVCQALPLPQPAVLTTDVAFAMPYEESPIEAPHGKRRIGLNVSALLYRRDIDSGDRISLSVDYPGLIDAIIQTLLDDGRSQIYLVPHVLAAHTAFEDDYALAQTIQEKFPQVILAPRFRSPIEAKSYISGLDLLIGSRMHATIAGVSSGTPVFALSYSRKFTGLFGSLGYPWVGDMTSTGNDAILEQFKLLIADLPKAKTEAEAANDRAVQSLSIYSEALKEILVEHAAKAEKDD